MMVKAGKGGTGGKSQHFSFVFVLTQTVTTSALRALITAVSAGNISLCHPGSHSSQANSPWMSLASPSPFPGSLSSARHSFPRMFSRQISCGGPRLAHTYCRQSTFTCDGKTCNWWKRGGWHASAQKTHT